MNLSKSNSQKGFRILQKSSLSPSHKLSPEKQKLSFKTRKNSELLKLMVSPKLITNQTTQEGSFVKREQTLQNSQIMDVVLVVVHVGQQQFRFTFTRNITTTQMRAAMMQKLKLKIVAFTTIDHNILIDYYLTLEERPIIWPELQLECQEPVQGSQHVSLKDFQILKCIGAGGFSKVYLVRSKLNGHFYAMKLVDKEFIIKYKKAELLQNERDIMAFIYHPFTIQMLFSFESRNFVVFILEFCSGGELFYQLKTLKRMSEEQAQFYFVEICICMLYLHQMGIMYRDIKPENILLDLDGHIRISDFGLSKLTSPDEFAYSFCGSPEYMAPEMLLKRGHTIQVDHYCLGALLYELVTGLPPFYSKNTQKIYDSILNEQVTFPQFLSQEIKELMSGLLAKDPNKRLGVRGGVREILQHKWFKKVNMTDILMKRVTPPIKPDIQKLNFETKNLQQGDLEVREKLIGKAGFKKDFKIFDEFYFDYRENVRIVDQQRLLKEHMKNVDSIQQQKPRSLDKIISEDTKQTKLQKRLEQQTSLRTSPQKASTLMTNNFMQSGGLKTESSDLTSSKRRIT
ncbi:unnamed protein product [Paramecium sonneborni]|uniref:Protein kinase domain-containing protein n=1 Tax=Paramecium sonneborni TaxID=65129 RepID=A0A8S1QZN5_9CILI|nr:unnamed protein product [Paramecium sonneborni]